MSKEINKEVGARVKELRKSAGLKQYELAAKLGVTSSSLSQIESGKIGISIPMLNKLTAALGVTTEAIIG